MAKPTVVIVGRPNVGKSTLFNRITKTRTAIVENVPGVTRDRNYLDAEWEGKQFIVVDTGGFYPDTTGDIFTDIREHALLAVTEGDVIIHLLDGKDGITPSDTELSRLLRTSGKPVLWAVNKIDGPNREDRIFDFYSIGAEALWPVSAETGYGLDDLLDRLVSLLPVHTDEKHIYPGIAVVGRPNAGKSTLINTLLAKDRMIVSPVPGTTRDSIDSICTYYRKKYLFIDTAGIKRKDRIGYSLERFAMVRSLKSIERCDIALIVIDASEGIVDQDVRIAGIVEGYGKGAVFLLNKWDLMPSPEDDFRKMQGEISRKIWFMGYAPVLTISATEKKRVTKVFPIINDILKERRKRIPTGDLNKCFREVVSGMPIPLYRGHPVKLYYITQIKTNPPAFTVFTNYPKAIQETHIRHMAKVIRNLYSFRGTPIRIYVKKR